MPGTFGSMGGRSEGPDAMSRVSTSGSISTRFAAAANPSTKSTLDPRWSSVAGMAARIAERKPAWVVRIPYGFNSVVLGRWWAILTQIEAMGGVLQVRRDSWTELFGWDHKVVETHMRRMWKHGLVDFTDGRTIRRKFGGPCPPNRWEPKITAAYFEMNHYRVINDHRRRVKLDRLNRRRRVRNADERAALAEFERRGEVADIVSDRWSRFAGDVGVDDVDAGAWDW